MQSTDDATVRSEVCEGCSFWNFTLAQVHLNQSLAKGCQLSQPSSWYHEWQACFFRRQSGKNWNLHWQSLSRGPTGGGKCAEVVPPQYACVELHKWQPPVGIFDFLFWSRNLKMNKIKAKSRKSDKQSNSKDDKSVSDTQVIFPEACTTLCGGFFHWHLYFRSSCLAIVSLSCTRQQSGWLSVRNVVSVNLESGPAYDYESAGWLSRVIPAKSLRVSCLYYTHPVHTCVACVGDSPHKRSNRVKKWQSCRGLQSSLSVDQKNTLRRLFVTTAFLAKLRVVRNSHTEAALVKFTNGLPSVGQGTQRGFTVDCLREKRKYAKNLWNFWLCFWLAVRDTSSETSQCQSNTFVWRNFFLQSTTENCVCRRSPKL